MTGGWETTHIGADFDEDRPRRQLGDTQNRA
jgi:hypothetical protein